MADAVADGLMADPDAARGNVQRGRGRPVGPRCSVCGRRTWVQRVRSVGLRYHKRNSEGKERANKGHDARGRPAVAGAGGRAPEKPSRQRHAAATGHRTQHITPWRA
jgi:hypothetical protein|eukprot:7379399-Prymnesium_polylepis.1